MSDGIFKDRFWSYRQPAWHLLGRVSQEPMGAQEAFSQITPYSVSLRPLQTTTGVLTPYRAIVREPVPDDPQEVIFGIVGNDYVLVDPQRVCEIYDDSISQTVETLGALDQGRHLFLSTKLPSWEVKDEELENYLILSCPYDGVTAIQVFISHIRPVCQNTLRAARSSSTEVYKIVHGTQVEVRLQSWMTGLYDRALVRSEFLQAAFGRLADLKISSSMAPTLIESIYPMPKPPVKNAPDEVMEPREKEWEYQKKVAEKNREAVTTLFEGAGTGLDSLATKNTGYGLLQAVVEWENYRPTTSDLSRGTSILYGERGRKMEYAFSIIDSLISGG